MRLLSGSLQIVAKSSLFLTAYIVWSSIGHDGIGSVKALAINTQSTSSLPCYDWIIVGAGASGLFASGAASLLGKSTCLIDQADPTNSGLLAVGGDCSNAACVPSKALRSIARQGVSDHKARQYADAAINAVRARESPDRIRNTTDLYFVQSCRFVSTHEMEIQAINASEPLRLRARRFLIATGASPIVPETFQAQAKAAGLPLYTYRSILQSVLATESSAPFWKMDGSTKKRLLIVGGGATACELGQTLVRLRPQRDICLVAPSVLPSEDVKLQQAAMNILAKAGIHCHWSARLARILPDGRVELSDGALLSPFDGALLCLGRSPVDSLESLHLDSAGIAWTNVGVTVHEQSLRSVSAPHVFASGDCADAVPLRSRTAAQAAWTGFYAIRNGALPRVLTFGSASVHPTVPRVVYTDPELACVGKTVSECVLKYGLNGFDVAYCTEEGSDRADMERVERDTSVCFVELRAEKRSGIILGCTACGPAAAELANVIGVAITNKLTTSDVARSIFSYPSHGYLLHRLALSMALSDTNGILEVCGPIGGFLGRTGRSVSCLRDFFQRGVLGRKRQLRKRQWEAEGAFRTLYPSISKERESNQTENKELLSYNHVAANTTLCSEIENLVSHGHSTPSFGVISKNHAIEFLAWAERNPSNV